VTSSIFDTLTDELSRLPGIGRKTALRLAFSLVDDKDLARDLSEALRKTWESVGECSICRNLTEDEVCSICADESRSGGVCVVQTPADLRSIEEAGLFRGRYFVLHGHLAPLDGVGPGELGVDKLQKMVSDSSCEEVILALDSTADGDATSAFLARVLEGMGISVSRLARGLPPGASVEFADALTLSQAFEGRQRV
jgi:recombination protein RecR